MKHGKDAIPAYLLDLTQLIFLRTYYVLGPGV